MMPAPALMPKKRYAANTQSAHMPAPTGGLNTLNPGGDMPPTDCISLVNMTSSDLGLRARLGWKEWITNLPEAEQRTLIPYTGSAKSGANNRLFTVTRAGIYGASASTITPTQLVAFPVVSANSGYGTAHTFVTLGGHFLVYVDEENGYYLYTESLDSWEKVVSATQTPWAGSTVYAIGDLATNDTGKVYLVVSVTGDAKSAGSGGPTGTGQAITDNHVTWNFNHSVSGIDPAQFVHVTEFKGRLLFTQKDSAQFWYLGLLAFSGAATQFPLGLQFRAGGILVGLYNWTVNGGINLDNDLVAISSGGDVAVYQGTDITSASSFGLKGVWYVGGLPSGRKIATEIGGDMLILSAVGLVPLSKIITGNIASDPSQYATGKVSNLFNSYVQQYGSQVGWSVVLHPEDNTIIVLTPKPGSIAGRSSQLATGIATRGWSTYDGLDMCTAAAWGGKLYFGTSDGRVLINTGYVDGVTIANPNASTPIQWSLLTSFQDLSTPRQKRMQWIRPYINSQSVTPTYQAVAKYDFDTSAQGPVSASGGSTSGAWDTAKWDSGVWSGDYVPSHGISGGSGIGSFVAVAIRGTATSKTVLAGIDVGFDVGGVW